MRVDYPNVKTYGSAVEHDLLVADRPFSGERPVVEA
jgi:hypothetical protein